MKKKLLSVALVATMVLSSAVSAFAADSISGTAWWATGNTKSTAVALNADTTVAFDIKVTADVDGGVGFMVEATDGKSYMTSTSAGDIWGAGTEKDDTYFVSGVTNKAFTPVKGDDYTLVVERTGESFEVTLLDDAEQMILLETSLSDADTEVELWGETTVYIGAQVGTFSVETTEVPDFSEYTRVEPATEATKPAETTNGSANTNNPETETTKKEDATTNGSVDTGKTETETESTKKEDATTGKTPVTGGEDSTTNGSATTTDTTVDAVVSESEAADIQKAAKVEGMKDTLVVKAVDASSADFKVAAKAIGDKVKFAVVDLTLASGKQPVAGTKVTLPLMQAIKDAKFVKVSAIKDGKMETVAIVKVADGKITFEPKHFSTYVFSEATEAEFNAANTDSSKTNTGDSTTVAMTLAIAAVAAGAVVVARAKRKENA